MTDLRISVESPKDWKAPGESSLHLGERYRKERLREDPRVRMDYEDEVAEHLVNARSPVIIDPERTKKIPINLHEQIGSGGDAIVYRASLNEEHRGELGGIDEFAFKVAYPCRMFAGDSQRGRELADFNKKRWFTEYGVARELSAKSKNVLSPLFLINDDERGITGIGTELAHTDIDLGYVARHFDKFPLSDKLGMLVEANEAVTALHDIGYLYVDWKPSNILHSKDASLELKGGFMHINGDRRILLADYGGAMPIRDSVGRFFVGTLDYASPEQLDLILDGRFRRASRPQLSVRSDVYGSAAVLYSLVTGNNPRDLEVPVSDVGPDAYALLLSQTKPEVYSTATRADRKLQSIIFRGLEENPKKRYSNMAEFNKKLKDFKSKNFENEKSLSLAKILGFG